MTAEDDEFRGIWTGIVDEEATEMLDQQIERTRMWRVWFLASTGMQPTMADLIRRIASEPAPRPTVMASYGAALWKLSE